MMKRILFLSLALGLLPLAASAKTTLFLQAPPSVRPGVEVPVILKARLDQSINAIHATIRFDPSRAIVTGVDDSGSVVRHWLDGLAGSASGSLALDGIIPGGVGPGFTGEVTIAQLVMRFSGTGRTTLTIEDALVYLNQPQTTLDALTVLPLVVDVRQDAPEVLITVPSESAVDADIRIIRELAINNGAWTLVSHVRINNRLVPIRIRERVFGLGGGAWRDATGVDLLSDQRLVSIIDVGVASGSRTVAIETIVPGRLQALFVILLTAAVTALLRLFVRRRN